MIMTILGGLGMFLLGMMLMTESLKAAGGDSLRRILSQFTGGKFKGIFSGAVITSLVQSSSATSVATIGFVSAGLLTFAQGLAIIFGANLGTTSTGWLVSVLGLKYSVSALALPMIGFGVFIRMFMKGKYQNYGMVIAGFGLLFTGIDLLQEGLSGISQGVNLDVIPLDTFSGRAVLLLIGMVMTVIMLSSSVAVAATMTALHVGTISLDQAAILVIGQNIGTTITAVLAVIGSLVAAKRTALGHIFFNVITGVLAFLALPLFTKSVIFLAGIMNTEEPAILLAIFHTLFNVVGIVILSPFLGRIVHSIEILIKEEKPSLTQFLEESIVEMPSIAVEAVRLTVISIFKEVVLLIAKSDLPPEKRNITHSYESLVEAIRKTQEFLSKISHVQEQSNEYNRFISVLHATDHLDSVLQALAELEKIQFVAEDSELSSITSKVPEKLKLVQSALESQEMTHTVSEIQVFSQWIAERRKSQRLAVLKQTANGKINFQQSHRIIEQLRWVDGIWYHLWRSLKHIAETTESPLTEGKLL